jgi:hypothetical protein
LQIDLTVKKNLYALAALLLLFSACKKESNSGGGSQGSGSLIRVQEGTDPNIANDTVYLLSYNAEKKISVFLDSLYQDSLVASYDASGNLIEVDDNGSNGLGSSSLTYNANNQLTEIDEVVAGEKNQYLFTYTNGIVSKKTYNTDFGSGEALQLYSYDNYTLTAGNITDMKEYDASNNLTSETTFTYGPQANPFQQIGLFNFGNRLGTSDIAAYETFFDKNILTGFSISGQSATMTNSFNSSQQLTRVIDNDQIYQGIFTWIFSYK